MNNKRGQSMSTNTIILLILGLIVLVVLILGFTMGWDKVAPFIKSSNVDNVVNTCDSACSIQSKYDFCNTQRDIKDGEGNKVKTSCYVLAGLSEFEIYSVNPCDIDCGLSCSQVKINNQIGVVNSQEAGYDVSALVTGLQDSERCIVSIE
ncbi:MAG: hypothetical protein WC812_03610 [Candidatus Pacearchaeota archaeon]|jgi:hypothetical protein